MKIIRKDQEAAIQGSLELALSFVKENSETLPQSGKDWLAGLGGRLTQEDKAEVFRIANFLSND